MKKIALVFGMLCLVALGCVVALPFFIQVDRYRPQLVQLANEHLNGKLQLGKLSLSLWGQFRIQVDGLQIADREDRTVLGVQDASFSLPYSSLWVGKPELTLKLSQPQINVVRDRNRKLNVMSLMRTSESLSSQPQTQKGAGGSVSTQASTSELPSWVLAAKLGMEVMRAQVNFHDQGNGFKAQISDLNAILKDISLEHPTDIEVWANLDTKMGESFGVQGPIRWIGQAHPQLKGGQLDLIRLVTQLRLDTLKINDSSFSGTAGMNADLRGLAATQSQTVDYQVKFSEIQIEVKTPKFKAPVSLAGEFRVLPDQVDHITAVLQAPGNELKAQGKVVSFTHPRIDFQVTSSMLDFDQLVNFSTTTSPSTPLGGVKKETPVPGSQSPSQAVREDFDQMLAPMRENQILGNSIAHLGVEIKSLKSHSIQFSDVSCQMTFQDLTLGLNECGFKVFEGKIRAESHLQFKPKSPVYQWNVQVIGLEIAQAVESKLALFKNTVMGKAQFQMKGQGSSLNPDVAISRLHATGMMRVDHAVFTTIDVSKMAADALNQALRDIEGKVPGVRGKTVSLPQRGSTYEYISSNFTIEGGKFSAPNFIAKALPHQGLDLKGSTVIGLKDYSLDTAWEVTDTYNDTHLRDLSVEVAGVKVENVLAEGSAPIHFPIHVGCTLKAPCFSSADIPAHLGKIALANVAKAVSAQGKDELRRRAESLLQNAPPSVQNTLKGLFQR